MPSATINDHTLQLGKLRLREESHWKGSALLKQVVQRLIILGGLQN